jgi:NADPH-dependent 2,4-dienoyl-CoA reductase/sulfur reductase-like enzyme
MPYNIADPGRDIEDLVVREAHVFREKQGIDLRTEHRVEAIDPAAKVVRGKTLKEENFELPYDKLLIATGASPIIPDLPGFDLPGVMALKTLEDGREIKQFIHAQSVNKAIIIGMGYIALEMCEALHDRNIGVEMVKPRPALLPWMHEKLAEMVKEEIESNAIKMHLGHQIKKIEKKDGGLRVICSDLELEGQMVLVAIGVNPNSQLAEQAGIELGPKNAIAVDKGLLTSDPHIYAAGDCADAFHVVTDQRTWIPLALRANRAGWAVADNVMGRKAELQGVAGTAAFKVLGVEVARTGLSLGEADKSGFEPVEIMIQSSTRAHRHPGASTIGVQMVGDRKSGRLLGAQLVGREGAAHRINAAAVALHAKLSVEEFGQSDLAYAPPFGPTWDPLLTGANQLLKRL